MKRPQIQQKLENEKSYVQEKILRTRNYQNLSKSYFKRKENI